MLNAAWTVSRERKRGISRDHEHIREPRQIRCQILGDRVREILLIGVVTEIDERQHDNRQSQPRAHAALLNHSSLERASAATRVTGLRKR